jgi:iron(III) transport system ATP-binding protein
MSYLLVEGVSKAFGETLAVDGIDLAVAAGTRTAIVGPSGSGKTTLLRVIAGFDAPDAGRVTLDDRLLAQAGFSVPAHLRNIGYVPQDGALFPHLNVAENVGFGLDRYTPHRNNRILALLDMVELDASMLERRPDELSGGQQQRVALARALARQPKLMLLDEPFSALDAGLRESMRKAVARVLQAASITTILVTHDQTEALTFADQVAMLRDGKLVQAGAPRELYFTPKDRGIADFFGETIVIPAELRGGMATCRLGRVAVDRTAKQGRVDIMLRPEQLHLALCGPAVAAGECYGRVTGIEFGGAASMISVALEQQDSPDGLPYDASRPLWIKASSVDMPLVGMRVKITVLGTAHVLS